jgi:ParB/RepB/Spo0J family partition protein
MPEQLAVISIPLAKIEPSKTNPRKTFPKEKLDELAVSIRASGVIVPIAVRPHPTKNHGSFELVDGECRWRASQAAGCSTIPALVEDLEDEQVAERQLIGYAQRVDLSPIEQADGFRRLMEEFGYDVERVASKTGRSPSTVQKHLQLCRLGTKGRELVAGERMSLGAAFVIARLESEKAQAEALKKLTSGYDFNERDGFISERDAREHVERNFILKLAEAPFSTSDATLVAAAGACGPCPHRTGNQGELFSDIKGKDLCTKPSCFEAKCKADFDRKAELAKERGDKVMSKTEVREVFSPYGGMNYGSKYIELDADVSYDVRHKLKGSAKTWRSALGKDCPTITLAQHNGVGKELVLKADALAALKKAEKFEKKTLSPKEKKQRAEDRDSKKVSRTSVSAAITDIVHNAGDATFDMATHKNAAFWRWLVQVIVLHGDTYNASRMMEERRTSPDAEDDAGSWDFDEQADAIVENSSTPAAVARRFAIELLVCNAASMYSHNIEHGDPDDPFQLACRLFGVDWKKTVAAAKKEVAGGGTKDAADTPAKKEDAKKPKRKGGGK